jgi:Flp pilus assembly protein TadG
MRASLHASALHRFLNRFLSHDGGAAAVEFSFIAPVLIVMILGIVDVGRMMVQASNMETALRAGVQYAVNGGTDMSVAQAVANQAWTGKPGNGTMTAQSACTCSGASASCTQPCADGTYPQSHFTIVASGKIGGSFMSTQKSMTKTVRLR